MALLLVAAGVCIGVSAAAIIYGSDKAADNRRIKELEEELEEERDQRPPSIDKTFSMFALEKLEIGLCILDDQLKRDRLAEICRTLHRNRCKEGDNQLNLEYITEGAQDPSNTLCIYFSRIVREDKDNPMKTSKTYNGVIIGNFQSIKNKRTRKTTLVIQIDVLLARKGCGKKVLQPLLNMDFQQFATQLKESFHTIEFQLRAIDDPDVIRFYEKHEFVRTIAKDGGEAVEEGLVPMTLQKQFPRLLAP